MQKYTDWIIKNEINYDKELHDNNHIKSETNSKYTTISHQKIIPREDCPSQTKLIQKPPLTLRPSN